MDASPVHSEKLSIKNLLFTKAIPSYKLPVPTHGRSFFSCKDCGDRFIIKSSYEYHIKRKSLKITYFCRHCNIGKVFFNRCDLLSHIRSHVFKTANININDLKVEPLPLSYYNIPSQMDCESEATPLPLHSAENQDYTEKDDAQDKDKKVICFECKQNIFSSGSTYKDRAMHYTQYQNLVYSCPVCLLTLSTKCALEAHLRFHLRESPYFCSDCGMLLKEQAAQYPFTHYCESFKMMRATAKLKCSVNNCNKIFHPSESVSHLKSYHLKSVFKCSICTVACYKWINMVKHLDLHNDGTRQIESRKIKHIDFVQCEMCPGKLIIPNQIVKHLKGHVNKYVDAVYPCWTCGAHFEFAKNLIVHIKFTHPDIYMAKTLGKLTKTHKVANLNESNTNLLSGTSKSSDDCDISGVSQCQAELLSKSKADSTQKIVCNLCQVTTEQDWDAIKEHFAVYHKEHVCIEAKVSLKRMIIDHNKTTINVSKKKQSTENHRQKMSSNVENNCVASKISNNPTIVDNSKFVCSKCGQGYENKQNLEAHIVDHRDPFMAYQCMECGESFITKPSFSTHLLVKHGIDDVSKYIDEKNCYSEESLYSKSATKEKNEPIKENQCNICREQFSNSTDFEKHFRIHGMAFLMKSSNKSTSPDKL